MSMGKGYFQEISNRTVPERTPKPKYLRSRSQLTERGPLGFGPIQFLFQNLNPPQIYMDPSWLLGKGYIPLTKSCQDMFQPVSTSQPRHTKPRGPKIKPPLASGWIFGGAGFWTPKPLGSKKGADSRIMRKFT